MWSHSWAEFKSEKRPSNCVVKSSWITITLTFRSMNQNWKETLFFYHLNTWYSSIKTGLKALVFESCLKMNDWIKKIAEKSSEKESSARKCAKISSLWKCAKLHKEWKLYSNLDQKSETDLRSMFKGRG